MIVLSAAAMTAASTLSVCLGGTGGNRFWWLLGGAGYLAANAEWVRMYGGEIGTPLGLSVVMVAGATAVFAIPRWRSWVIASAFGLAAVALVAAFLARRVM